ncbi:MAG TPA: TIGR02147 family protein [Pseudobdellovibrionaceae bacterium]
MVKSWDDSFILNLLACQDYRAFMALFFQRSSDPKKRPKKLSFQRFSTLAGYASKSYPAEILSGRKNLKYESIEKFAKGLSLNQTLSEYFKNLVLIDLTNSGVTDFNIEDLKKRNDSIRIKIIAGIKDLRSSKKMNYSGLQKVLLQENFSQVFAALGSPQVGASLKEIKNRTGLEIERLVKILSNLEKEKVIRRIENRYFLESNSIDFEFLESDIYFKRNFVRSSTKALKCFDKQSRSASALYMTQTFSVHTEKLPALKNTLSSILREFSENAECPDGDQVAEICLSFTTVK